MKSRDEQEAVQKRTFTKWINSHLAKRNPPIVVNDLFIDIKDGVMLLALLEVLSGQKLPGEQGRKLKRIHWVSNIGTALKFLEGRRVRIKLVNINSTDIVDGRPSIVLGLMWTIILYFQIEELTSNLTLLSSLSSSTSSVDSQVNSETASPPSKRKVVTPFKGNAKKALLKWVQYTAGKRAGIEVKDFGPSWRSGFAFHSVIHAIRPDLTDLEKVKSRSNRENLDNAFTIAESELGIPRLLEVEDVDVDKPDEKSIMTYVAQFLKHYPDPKGTNDGVEEDVSLLRELKAWLEQFERDLKRVQVSEASLQERYLMFRGFRAQYDMKKKSTETLIQPLQKDGKLLLDQVMVKQAWERVTARLQEWHIQLDKSLPAPLGTIGGWLHRAEAILAEEIVIQEAHDETANIIQRKLELWVQASLRDLELILSKLTHRQAFHQIHRAGAVNRIPIPPEQLEDMAKRFHFITTASTLHLTRLDFLELKHRLQAFQVLTETKLKSWIIKYGRRESVEVILQNYICFVEENKFFEHYEITFQSLKQAADLYSQIEDSEREGINKFLNESVVQWRNLSVEVRSVRSMLEEVLTNWDKYSGTVVGLQAWLEDAEKTLNKPETAKREFFRHLPHWIQQHTVMNDAGNFLIETCDELVSRDLKQQLLLLNGRWRDLFVKVKHVCNFSSIFLLCKHHLITKVMKHLDATVLQKKLLQIQTGFQNMMEKGAKWKKQMEANSSLMKRFEDCRKELEMILATAHRVLQEKGNPEQLLGKHTDFCAKLDQRVLNSFLKACDELTDILPEQEQQSLQETVRNLHKQWKHVQAEAPYYLLRLQIEVARNKLIATMEECKSELDRERKCLNNTSSEQLVRQHRDFFSEKGKHQWCVKRVQVIGELCQKLPSGRENEAVREKQEVDKKSLRDLKSLIAATYEMLLDQPDKWKEYTSRYERDLPNFVSWFERCEAVPNSWSPYISADQTKLQNEVQMLLLSCRIRFLEQTIENHQHFDKCLLQFSYWIERFLSGLQTTSEISFTDLQPALNHIKVGMNVKLFLNAAQYPQLFCYISLSSHYSKPHKQLFGRTEECFRLFQDANQTVERRKVALKELGSFLEMHRMAGNVLRRIRKTVKTASNWDKVKTELLDKELGDVTPDIKQLECQAVVLDGLMSKAQYHLKNISSESRSSCKALAQELEMELESAQKLLGTKQSEAEALNFLWKSFKERKEKLLKAIEDVEEKVDKASFKEVTALQHRLRFFNQLEEELNSQQLELQWLKDKAKQLSEKDKPLAAEADKEIHLLESLWNDLYFSNSNIKNTRLQSLLFISLSRDCFDNLCQKAQTLNELRYGNGSEVRQASQLMSQYQILGKTVKEKLRTCHLALQEHQAFEEIQQSTWTWLKGVQDKLVTIEKTTGSKATFEKQLLQVQEILLMKGEGEVKLNMAIGKGEKSLKIRNEEGQKVIQSQLQTLKDTWADVVSTSVKCHSHLEWVVAQWNSYLDGKNQLQQWMESLEQELSLELQQQPDLKEKLSELERSQSVLADVEKHSIMLNRLIEKARELLEKTGDPAFEEDAQLEMRTQFADIVSVRPQRLEDNVLEHQDYHSAVQELTDWLNSAKEELHRWSDMSGDSAALQRKLKKVKELIISRQNGKARLDKVASLAERVQQSTAAGGCEAINRELQALRSDWQQWEESTLQTQSGLEMMLSQMTSSEQQFEAQVAQLENDLQSLSARLTACSHSLSQLQDSNTDEEVVECWQKAKETQEALQEAENITETLKAQLNDLCRFSKDLSSHSEKVSSSIKEYNSLCLQASKYCQNKEKLLEQRFRATFREFQQWIINTRITTCFDTPQNIDEAAAIIQKLQDFLSESEVGQSKLNTLISKGELLSNIVSKERAEAIKVKISTAKEDWKNLLANLHQKDTALQNLQAQMKDFEAGVGPVQEWLAATTATVQESSSQLPDLPAKKTEQFRLQSVLEDITCHETQLNKLKEKAQHLWEEQASNKSFMHRVSQLSAQYLALNNLAKGKALRVQRTVNEHQQFAQGLKELQDWLADGRHMVESYCNLTADKDVLDSRMAKLEALLSLRQEKEIQLKMVLTRGEFVLRSTSPDGSAAIQQQMQDLKESWDSLLSICIQCKSQLEGALSQWTSYQDDVRQFVSWMDRMEEDLNVSDRQYTELRDKTAALGKAKVSGQVTAGTRKAEELVQLHREYQEGLKVFEDWVEQEKEKLSCCSHLGGDVETLENTLRDLEDLEVHCTEGQSLVDAMFRAQEKVALTGTSYLEDRILESVQQDWHTYLHNLTESKKQLNTTLGMLRRLEQLFQQADTWLSNMERNVSVQTGRKSDRLTKEAQLQQLQVMDEVGLLAHQVLEESHINSRVGSQATQLAARYQGILLHVMEHVKLLKEELKTLEDADSALGAFAAWQRAAQKNFRNVAVGVNVVDKAAMESKINKFEVLHVDIDAGNGLLKMIREKGEKAIEYLEGDEAKQLRKEMNDHITQLEELTGAIRRERGNLEKCLYLTKEFLDKYQSQTKWLAEYQAILQIPVEPKAELYEKKAQLAKYKVSQTIVSHEPGIKLVIEKGEALLELVHDVAVSDNLGKLLSEYQELFNMIRVCVQNLEGKVKEHEDYNSNLQEVEKWLLQMSTRLVAPDTTQSNNLEMATQHLARHKPIMEEIAGFEHVLTSLKGKGDTLIANCTEELQAKFKQQVDANLQGIRDSYSAICSTAQRVYCSLDRELQKHVSHQDTLQQCQMWLSTVKQELQLQTQPPISSVNALKQVKHYRTLQEQASTYLELLCSMCDLSDATVKSAATEIQCAKQMIEQHLVRSQELALGWEEIKRQKAELSAYFLDTEQYLQTLKRQPAELEQKITQKQKAQVQCQSKQNIITALTEKVSSLTRGHESPEHSEIGQLSNQWLELCHQVNSLLVLREEDQQRARDYHDQMNIVEVLLDKFAKEWDSLARADAESTAGHLEALRKLASVVQSQKVVLDDLKEQKQKVMDRLNSDDKELVKEQTSHFEKQWLHLENLIEKKIQASVTTLEEMSLCQAKLEELLEWAGDQQPILSEALKCSPPAELAQTLLIDHITICNELESQQLVHGASVKEAERILAHLGLDERQRFQGTLVELQDKMNSLSEALSQRRKYLSKALSDRTQFLMAVTQAINWIHQNEKKAMSEEHIALMPLDVNKQIRMCRNAHSGLKEHQMEVTALWAQGRELMKEATEEENGEMLNKLQQLQSVYDSGLQKSAQRLQELEKILVSRKYFKADMDKVCYWLKQTDIMTFAEVSLMNSDPELSSQLSKYQQILEESPEYENLLLLVQRTGREVLPSLSEMDHSFLDEKLNALPKQFNSLVALAKEKSDKVQEAIAGRKEYSSLIELTSKALSELEDQFVLMSKARLNLSSEETTTLQDDYKALLEEVVNLGKAVDELNQRKETFRITGQPWQPDAMASLASLYHRLRRQIEMKVSLLDETIATHREHEEMSLELEEQLKALKDELLKVNEETLSTEEKLKKCYSLAGSVQESSSLLKKLLEQVEQLSPELDSGVYEMRSQQVHSWQEDLQLAQGMIGERIMECESRLVQRIDFQSEIQRTLDWLREIKGDLSIPINVDVKLQAIQEEIRKCQILEEEVQSSLRIMAALSSREKDKYTQARELMPTEVEKNLRELSLLEASLDQIHALIQHYHRALQDVSGWLDDASELLQQSREGVDVEGSEEAFSRHAEFFETENNVMSQLTELQSLVPELLTALMIVVIYCGVYLTGVLHILLRCVTDWRTYQEARQQIIELMNQAERKLSEFSTAKAATSHESEEKLTRHKVSGGRREGARLGNDASKATISRSMTTVWQRWTRLRSVAREQEKMLEEAAHGWKNLTNKVEKGIVFQDRLPDSSVEKARKNELLDLLVYHDGFAKEVEREHATLSVLRQQALNMLRDVAMPSTSIEDYPVMHEIKAMQDRYDNVRQKIKKSKKMVQQELKDREDVGNELHKIKQWLQETKEYLQKPLADADTQLQELKEVAARQQVVEQLAEGQQNKYLELYTILPCELSEQLAEVTLALGAIEEQVELQFISLFGTTALNVNILYLQKIKDDLDSSNVKLVELDAMVQDFTEQNPQQSKHLTDSVIKLSSLYQQVCRQTEYRAVKLNKAAVQLEEFHEMLEFVLRWVEKAQSLASSTISWNSAAQLNDQLMTYQAILQESDEIHSDLEAMNEKLGSFSDVFLTASMFQHVVELSRQTNELQQLMQTRLQCLQDAAKDMEKFETEVRRLQVVVKQAQVSLTSSELTRLSLKEQLPQRQRLLANMEGFKQRVQAVQRCQAALRIPEEVVTHLPNCHIALRLQDEASRLQHTAIQQCNIVQEAVVQYEQYEQEMQHLQQLIERAHCQIQEHTVATSNIQQLQAQISRHEEFAQKIKSYQEQIAALNSKCKMLTVKAKHATMLLTVSEVEGLSEGMEELEGELLPSHSAHPSVVMMTAGRCHTLLSPVTEESGEEGTNSELSSPDACRSPSPVANSDVSVAAQELQTTATDTHEVLSAGPLEELFEPGLGETATSKIDDLQRSWETLKNVISEKQRTLYEALERQQKYQDSVQSVSTKMESIERKLGEALVTDSSPESQLEAHQALMDEIVTLQDEINELQICFAEELVSDTLDTETSEQLAMQSTLTVLAERMATIKMKALGKRQLLEEKLNELVEEERQEQALQQYCTEAEELNNWLLITKATLDTTLRATEEQMEMEEQLIDCQNMLGEIEQKVMTISELSVHSESLLLMEGKPRTREDAEHLTEKLRNLKGSLVELQKMLQEKRINIQHGMVQEKEDTESDSTFHTSPSLHEWLVQARSTRCQHQQDSLQRQKELEEQLAEQKDLIRSVASSGEKLLTQQTSAEFIGDEQKSTGVASSLALFKGEAHTLDKSVQAVKSLFGGMSQAIEDVSTRQKLYSVVSAASHWLDGVEDHLLASASFLPEKMEVHLYYQESLAKDIEEVTKELDTKTNAFLSVLPETSRNQDVIEETLNCMQERLSVLETAVKQRCEQMKDRLQELMEYQVRSFGTSATVSLLGFHHAEMSHKVQIPRTYVMMLMVLLNWFVVFGASVLSNAPFFILQDMYEELMMIVGSRRSSLNQSLALKDQYEQALQDLADMTDTGQEKMTMDQKILVNSRGDVQHLLDKHKEFFQGLESHQILTETLFKKVSLCIHQRETDSKIELMDKTSTLLKQAHRRGVELECILETWSRLQEDYELLYRQLETVENSIPSVGLVEESEERLAERITLYQRLKISLTDRQPQLYQVLDDGKRVLTSITCPELELQIPQLGERWLSSHTKVSKELHRLETVLTHWNRYQTESAELKQWLQSATERLEFWTMQSITVPQELDSVRDHLQSFLEFTKEIDSKSSLKSSVLSTGNQLLRLKRVDTSALRSGLAQIDAQWTELLAQIPVVQEKLHQLQMEKLPSRSAIGEIMTWISLMEKVIEEDETIIKNAVGSQMIEQFLKKYKGFKIDLSCKQLTVDFVNQSVLQISSQDVESKRSDKTDFAERLGVMNRKWQLLQRLITEKVQELEGLLESWMEYENGVQCLKTWFEAQEERLKKHQQIGDSASVHNALKDCQELEDLIRGKEKEMEKVEQYGLFLIQKKEEESCSGVMDTLRELSLSWANLDHLIGQLKVVLQSVLEQWNVYKEAYEEINGHLMEARYSISRFRLLTGSLQAVRIQVDNLIFSMLTWLFNPLIFFLLRCLLVRWNNLLQDIVEQLHSSKALLQLWQKYKDFYSQRLVTVQQHEESSNELIKRVTNRDILTLQEVLKDLRSLQDSLHILLELEEQLKQQVDPSAAAAIQSDRLSLIRRLSALEQGLIRQRSILQAGVQDYESFSKKLEALEQWIVEAEEMLKLQDPNRSSDLTIIQERMEELKIQMLRFSSMVPDLDRLNELGYRLPLNDKEIKRMQTLNRHWSAISAQTTERFSKLQAFLLQHQTFLEKCETWMEFLVQTEQKLAVEISGNHQNLLEQQRAHELFQAEMFSRQQILHSIISDGQHLLQQGQVDDRDEFNLKLAMLSNQWQGVIRRAQQRRGIIDSQIRQWQRYREMAEKLRKWLVETSCQPQTRLGSGTCIPLQQARALLDEVQLKEKVLQRQQGSYILTVEAGKQLLLSADGGSEAVLHTELTEIQEQWKAAHVHLEEQRKQLTILLKDWERCEKQICASLEKLRSFKKKLSQPLPDHHEELHTEQMRCMELESSFEGWTDDLTHLSILKDTLSNYVSADDLSILQERIELLHRQWDELCHQVSLRRQQVTEKLNEWAVFNEKNKELCEWLTQMESKVSQNGDISIEEMIDKLKKDYQEEISAASENKMQLQQMGQRLVRASHESKASEIEYKLGKVSDRWQHLLDLIGARVKKLKETLVAVQQLDKNMSSLRSWLAHIETELSKPIVYDTCDSQEIQQKLTDQQELQRDIEKHSTGVASVLNLCEVLLHDCDACATEPECDSIQQATRNLDRRWRNICAMSMERRLKIEETWRLWQKFLDDYSRFEDWLETSEQTAAYPNSSGVLYTVAKEELKKFEAFQRQVHESLTQLELINKQYRRLARENRTDSGCKLKQMVYEGNQRWDNLQRRVTAILRRLKYFIGQREEFETTRESILVWLTEMDLQLTNIEHFSECDIQGKIKQLKAFQQEISLNTNKIEQIFTQGEQLIEKSEPLDGTIIEEELDELHRYCQEVFGRVNRYYKKLMQLPLTDDEMSDRETDLDDSTDLSSLSWHDRSTDNAASNLYGVSRSLPMMQNSRDTRSGRDTPASVDSIPLEWDHDYDLSRGLETAVAQALITDKEDVLEDTLCTKRHTDDVVIPESPEAYVKLTESTLRSTSALDRSRYHLQQTENVIRSKTPTGPELDSSYWGYMKLLSECRGSIETVKRVGQKLKEEEDKFSGFINLTSTEKQTSGVVERWELIQAQALNKELRMKQNLQQWQQFNSDLSNIWNWLGETEEELEQLRRLDISTDIQTIEHRIKKLKELQKAVDNRKAIILSINLCSAEFTQSDTSDAQELQERLRQMNKHWDRVCCQLDHWRTSLQDALMQCHDFHEMSHGLLLWLENIDRRRNEILPIDPNQDPDTLQDHHKTLMQIKRELLESQLKVASLQELSGQLLVNAEGRDCLEAKEKVHVIGNRLKLLLKEVIHDLKDLERLLDISGSQLVTCLYLPGLNILFLYPPVHCKQPRGKSSLSQPGPSVSSPHSRNLKGSSHSEQQGTQRKPSFFLRVLRAALPLQLLLLLLIGLACLVPMTEEDYSCTMSNNFARSFHPMLRYTNGPPPI
uniref:Nesprin-1 n=1 Tax=Callorhinchus milii TaxID=7868 RepID=A0A4W3HCF8_CALMI